MLYERERIFTNYRNNLRTILLIIVQSFNIGLSRGKVTIFAQFVIDWVGILLFDDY